MSYQARDRYGRLKREIMWSLVRNDDGGPAAMRFHGEGPVLRRRKTSREKEAQCKRIGDRARRLGKWPPLWVLKTWRKEV